jgi:hypothetical protein
MRPAFYLAALVLAVLAFLAGRAVGPDADRAGATDVGGSAVGGTLRAGSSNDGGHPYLSEADLRRIIREELAARLSATAAAETAGQAKLAAAASREPANPRQVEAINRQVDAYIGAGTIADSEMAILQSDIAKLDRSARNELLGKLARAINAGALKGRL